MKKQLTVFLTLLLISQQAICEDTPIVCGDNGDGTLTDSRSGLIWQKCDFGQSWNGTTCEGESKRLNWYSAMILAKSNKFLGKADWRLPTSSEFLTVTTEMWQCLIPKQSGYYTSEVQSYWSITPEKNQEDNNHVFYLSARINNPLPHVYLSGARLVRAGTLNEGEGLPEFNALYMFAVKKQKELDGVANENAAKEGAKNKADEARLASFRKNLKVGDKVGISWNEIGLVLQVNGNLVRVQIGYNEKWFRRDALFPVISR
ncbi:MAG: DUF1566 domain-containing protein [Gallionellaceae bacterium]